MNILLNIIWLIFGGFFAAVAWFIVGLLCSITIVGIPIGLQFFKLARLMLTPFGDEVVINFSKHPILNILWLIFLGWEMAIGHLIVGVLLCVTIIGIPFGLQWFKLAQVALIPFGAEIRQSGRR